MSNFVIVILCYFFFVPVALALELDKCAETNSSDHDCEPSLVVEKATWFDDSRNYVGTSADDLAIWIDTFFSEPRSDIESAKSSLRLTYENQWQEGDGSSENIKLRGKIRLPGINKRLSLVFTDEEDNESGVGSDLNTLSSDSEDTQLSLQYRARKGKRTRVDYGLGMSSSLKGKAKVRYRYQVPWSETTTHRVTETLYFVDGEGFGLRSHYEIDYVADDNRLVRWDNQAKVAEEIEGVEWSTRLSLAERLSKQRAVSVFSWVNGETRPQTLTKSYGVGLLLRRNFYRPWLFLEVEPAYAWRRESVELSRNGAWLFAFRLEMMID